MTKEGPKLLGEIAEEHHVLGELVSWEERAVCHPPQPSPSSPNKGTSVGGQLWEQGERTIVGEPVTSALNAHSWQSGRINEGMTPKQCRANHYHSQQVEGSVGWDRHSSGDLRNRQMDGQDEENRRIYNQGDFTKRGTAIRKRQRSSIGGALEEEKKKSSSAEDWGRALTFPQPRCRRSNSLTIPSDRWRRPHKGPVLKPASLPNSLYWACWVWVCSHLQWREPPKSGPYNLNYIFL